MTATRRIAVFTRMSLSEYLRSGRILIELTLAIAFWGLFFQNPRGFLTMSQVFQLGGIFTLLLTLYTASSMLSLGDRPQGYLVLTRPLGRRGYLLGLYTAAVLVVWAALALVVVLTLLVNRPIDFGWRDMLLGSVPTMLNVALLAALMMLMSSMVLRNTPRLLLLAVIAVALYTNSWPQLRANPVVSALQMAASYLLVPAMRGFQLAQTRAFGNGGIFIMIAQVAMTVLLLSVALLTFVRRDLILSGR
jgi:hypothetical protein